MRLGFGRVLGPGTLILVVAAWSLGACAGREVTELSEQDAARVMRWLTCDECTEGELQAVVDSVGQEASGALREALMDPPLSYLDNAELAIGAAWDRQDAPSVPRDEYVSTLLSNYRATLQRRAAVALGALRRTDILEDAYLDRGAIGFRPDVEGVVIDLLAAAGASPSGFSPPVATSIVVRPSALDVLVGSLVPVEVLVLDASGRLLNQDVTWSSSDASTADIAPGSRRPFLVNGEALGTAVLTATIGSVAGQTTVTVIPPPGPPGSVRIALGDAQTDTVGNILPQPLVVEVLDGSGTEVSGVTVTFQVVRGDATVDTAIDTTDGTGRASTGLTLGNTPGMIWVDATASGLPLPGPWPRTSVRFQIRVVPS